MQEQVDSVLQSGLRAGTEAVESGQLDVALRIYQSLLGTEPTNAEIHNGLGVVWSVKGDFTNAARFLKTAVKYAPENGGFRRNLGAILLLQKRYKRAQREFEAALKIDPTDTDAGYKLATIFGAKQKSVNYENQLRSVISIQPDHFEANNDLGCHQITKGQINEAVHLLEVACASPKAVAGTFVNLGNAYVISNLNEKTKSTFEKAVELEPNNPDCLMALATIERNLGELDRAEKHALGVVSLVPESAPAKNLLGTIQRELARQDEALESFEQALENDQNFAPAQVNRGLIHLWSGNWESGFSDLESRWADPSYSTLPADINCPRWEGSDPDGKVIFLYTEQGLGDTIQNFRFAKSIVERGGKVVIEVKPELLELLSGADEMITVITPNSERPPVDLYCPLMSLPFVLNICNESDISGAPYLTSPEMRVGLEGLITKNVVNIGVNWAGAPEHKEDYKRSIDPSLFNILAEQNGVRFFDLHFGGAGIRPDVFDDGIRIQDTVNDFSESAAFINELDLVISVDTATLHLAGALGKPCWALIPYVPDWRWLADRDDTPWYRSVRLFRQSALGDWSSVMESVQNELTTYIEEIGIEGSEET
jgi:Tfp pilus assembly protein PilF